MSRPATRLFKAALSALHYSGLAGLIRPITGGGGAIFMLHHVSPAPARGFEPNSLLKVTPQFLETVIMQVKAAGFECIALDDVPERIKAPREAPFAAFTLDDGYKDNRDHAYPVFKKHAVPFTIYVPCRFADGEGDLWWLNLEETIRQADTITLDMDGERRRFAVKDEAEKMQAFEAVYWWLRRQPEAKARAVVRQLAREVNADTSGLCRDLVMDWDEIRALAADPLVTIGAHTVNHLALAKLPFDEARREIADSLARITNELGKPCRHLSYPYGAADSAGTREFEIARALGLATAVTTRKGLIGTEHRDKLTALPRFSLNGDFQEVPYFKALLSGVPFALWNAFERLNLSAPEAAAP